MPRRHHQRGHRPGREGAAHHVCPREPHQHERPRKKKRKKRRVQGSGEEGGGTNGLVLRPAVPARGEQARRREKKTERDKISRAERGLGASFVDHPDGMRGWCARRRRHSPRPAAARQPATVPAVLARIVGAARVHARVCAYMLRTHPRQPNDGPSCDPARTDSNKRHGHDATLYAPIKVYIYTQLYIKLPWSIPVFVGGAGSCA